MDSTDLTAFRAIPWGQMAAIGREAMNDIRGTVNQVFFGQSDKPPEIGTPMGPTQYMVNESLETYDQRVSQSASVDMGMEQSRGLSR